jgi:hypothetical protein
VSDFEHRRERDRLLGRAVRMRLDRGQRAGGRGLWMAAAVACVLVVVFVVAGARLAGHHVAERDSAPVPPSAAGAAPDEPPQYEVTSLAQGAWSTEETGRTARIVLTQGSAAFHVHRLKLGQRFLVTLPDGEIEVRGTRFVVDIEDGRTRYVVVMEGKVAFRHAGSPEALLLGGQRWDAPVAGARPPMSAEALSAPSPVRLRRTRLHRSAAPHASPTSPSALTLPVSPASPASVAPSPDAASRISSASEQFARAMSVFRAARYNDADVLLREFIARNPGDPRIEDATFLRMVGCVRRRDPEGAAEMARRYLGQFPDGLCRREAEQVLQAPH